MSIVYLWKIKLTEFLHSIDNRFFSLSQFRPLRIGGTMAHRCAQRKRLYLRSRPSFYPNGKAHYKGGLSNDWGTMGWWTFLPRRFFRKWHSNTLGEIWSLSWYKGIHLYNWFIANKRMNFVEISLQWPENVEFVNRFFKFNWDWIQMIKFLLLDQNTNCLTTKNEFHENIIVLNLSKFN